MKDVNRICLILKACLITLILVAACMVMGADPAPATEPAKEPLTELATAPANEPATEPAIKHEHVHMNMEMPAPNDTVPVDDVGLDEHLGEIVPGDLVFIDENGKPVRLGDLMDRPVLLQLVFFHCPQSCSLMMAGLATILKDVTFTPGKEFRIVSISFDHEDTPEITRETKFNYMKLLKPGFPENEWHFLTGDPAAINGVTKAVGFRFKRVDEHNFIHTNVLIALGPGGKIIRYLYGTSYLPFDVSMALTEASRGTPALSIKKLMTYCFDYDPKGKRYVFKTFRIMGGAVLLALGAFLLFLIKGKTLK